MLASDEKDWYHKRYEPGETYTSMELACRQFNRTDVGDNRSVYVAGAA